MSILQLSSSYFYFTISKGKSYLKIANPTSKGLTLKAGTAIGCVSFELIRDLSLCANTITHLHQDMDGSSARCSLSMSACPINHRLGIDSDIVHSHTCLKPYNHTPHDYPTCAESLHMSKRAFHHTYHNDAHRNRFTDNQYEIMMRDYYSHNQDKMTPAQIRELKVKTFPYYKLNTFNHLVSSHLIYICKICQYFSYLSLHQWEWWLVHLIN